MVLGRRGRSNRYSVSYPRNQPHPRLPITGHFLAFHYREDKAHDLARQKFQRDTCNLFLKWNEDSRAQEIAASSGSNADKIEALGHIMFGDEWDESLPQYDVADVATPAEGIAQPATAEEESGRGI